ncbi:MAG TPA: phosphate ABC transporter substrate-binding protein PstS [Cryobacterium sp.]|nr:phosphate ABC transporter substrate-binding protein PstS [Cryobacterium sp.]
MKRRLVQAAAGTAIASLMLAGCAANEAGDTPSALRGTLDGAGSSAQAAAQEVWVSEFQKANSRVTINYDPTGSGAGREQFIGGGVDFAGSDSALSDDELAGEFAGCAPGSRAIDLPMYVSPLVLIFNVEGLDALRLDAATIAGIFSGAITKWNDPALVALNPDAPLPSTGISAVHRSDDSGTTKNFADYLYQNVPEVWTEEPADAFPFGGEGAQGNSGVVSAVTNGRNTIGYADASRAAGLNVASLRVGDEFVDFSAEAAAAIIDASPSVARENPNDLVIDVDRKTTAAGVYPLVLVSYLIACEVYPDAEQAELVRAYLSFIAGAEGQQAAAKGAGSAPLSSEVSTRVLAAVETIE